MRHSQDEASRGGLFPPPRAGPTSGSQSLGRRPGRAQGEVIGPVPLWEPPPSGPRGVHPLPRSGTRGTVLPRSTLPRPRPSRGPRLAGGAVQAQTGNRAAVPGSSPKVHSWLPNTHPSARPCRRRTGPTFFARGERSETDVDRGWMRDSLGRNESRQDIPIGARSWVMCLPSQLGRLTSRGPPTELVRDLGGWGPKGQTFCPQPPESLK